MLRRSLSLPLVVYTHQSSTTKVHKLLYLVRAGTWQQLSTSSRAGGVYKVKETLRNSYTLLNLTEDADLAEVKEAYIKSVKLYHPDSGSDEADPVHFSRVREAYKNILEQSKEAETAAESVTDEEVDKIIFDIRHTAPQHRQYLSFEGIGTGTPTQRQKVYQQYRVARAADNVHDYRTQHLANQEESAVVVRDKQQAKKTKISNAIERLVEDMIQDSMNKGDFDNLAGKGKPLSYENRNPLLDTDTHNLNKILINNGYAPEWIMLQSEIRKNMKDARIKLAVFRSKMGSPPFEPEDVQRWKSQVAKHRAVIEDVNLKIDRFNMIVPFLDKQMVRYSADRDTHRIYTNWHCYLPKNQQDTDVIYDAHFGRHQIHYPMTQHKVNWTEVWMHIKQVFKS